MLTGQQKRRTLNEATLGALFLTCLSLFNSTHAASTEPPSQLPNDKTTAIDATENPNPFTTDLVLQPTYNHIETGGWSYTQVNQLIYPYSSTVIPGVHVKELHSWFRFEFPFIYQVSPGLNQFGLQDFTFIDGVVKDTSFGAVGIGADLRSRLQPIAHSERVNGASARQQASRSGRSIGFNSDCWSSNTSRSRVTRTAPRRATCTLSRS